MAGLFVGMRVGAYPCIKLRIGFLLGSQSVCRTIFRLKLWRAKAGLNGRNNFGWQAITCPIHSRKFCVHLGQKSLCAQSLHQYLDTRLVHVIASAVFIINTQNGFQIRNQIFFWQVITQLYAHNRGAAQATANVHLKHGPTVFTLAGQQADIMKARSYTILLAARNGNLELTWQEREFRMQGGPLAQDFSMHAGVQHFIRRRTGKLI